MGIVSVLITHSPYNALKYSPDWPTLVMVIAMVVWICAESQSQGQARSESPMRMLRKSEGAERLVEVLEG